MRAVHMVGSARGRVSLRWVHEWVWLECEWIVSWDWSWDVCQRCTAGMIISGDLVEGYQLTLTKLSYIRDRSTGGANVAPKLNYMRVHGILWRFLRFAVCSLIVLVSSLVFCRCMVQLRPIEGACFIAVIAVIIDAGNCHFLAYCVRSVVVVLPSPCLF